MWRTKGPSSVCSMVNARKDSSIPVTIPGWRICSCSQKTDAFLWSYLQLSLHTSGMWGTKFHSWCLSMQMLSYISLHFYWILWWQSKNGEGVCPYLCCSHEWRRAKHTPSKQDYSHVSGKPWNVNITVSNHHHNRPMLAFSEPPPSQRNSPTYVSNTFQCILMLIFKEFKSFRPSMHKDVQTAFTFRLLFFFCSF